VINRLLPLLLALCAALPAAGADVRFLAFGDSVTIGHGSSGIICPDNVGVDGYPPRLLPRLAGRGLDAEILNFGFCGERTDAGITRIDTVLAVPADVILIMEGTNDVSGGVGFETTLFNLREMARKADAVGTEPVLASLVPRGPEAPRDSNNGKTYTIADRLEEDAAAGGWTYADPFHALFDVPDFFELYYFDQLHPDSSGYHVVAEAFADPAVEAANRQDSCAAVPPGPCTASSTVLCLSGGRFRLEAFWENFTGGTGVGTAVPQTNDTGAFYWFDPQNIELTIKVLDGRGINGHFWVYYGALSNVKFSLLVTDTQTGRCREYFNPLATFASVGDDMAFLDQDLPGPQ